MKRSVTNPLPSFQDHEFGLDDRIGKMASLIVQKLDCDESTCFMIKFAARLHDIGRIAAPDAVLLNLGNSLMPI
jgi:response regulator RpfG family c-di-GMP phosphodiesterase